MKSSVDFIEVVCNMCKYVSKKVVSLTITILKRNFWPPLFISVSVNASATKLSYLLQLILQQKVNRICRTYVRYAKYIYNFSWETHWDRLQRKSGCGWEYNIKIIRNKCLLCIKLLRMGSSGGFCGHTNNWLGSIKFVDFPQ
jgi:hypothetical protein